MNDAKLKASWLNSNELELLYNLFSWSKYNTPFRNLIRHFLPVDLPQGLTFHHHRHQLDSA